MSINPVNQLVLKSINQLLEYNFFIPSYQRGYRWTETQVNQLLDDIWQFAKEPPDHKQGKEKPFYCLQPIVVRKRKGSEELEVIDGQQRLTTIFLILKKLQNLIETSKRNFSVSYETRPDSKGFLENVETKSEEDAMVNIDYYHIWRAYKIIQKWFQNKADNSGDATPSASIAPVFLNSAKVIWYEINETENSEKGGGPIDIFTRLNIGKIPLTNAELVKALFLQKDNFSKKEATLKQIQIAAEWDLIEKTLQDDSFWFFIYNPENPLKYDNRIEYIFDLMKGRTKESEYYHTFNKFREHFPGNIKDNSQIDDAWREIREYFLTFEEWFKDYELFHYIGYLIACVDEKGEEHVEEIIEIMESLKSESRKRTKIEFKEYLKGEIRKRVGNEIDSLEYAEDGRTRKVLLLFNIQTVLETQKSEMRFPFHKYKSDGWDIEHVRSKNDKEDTDRIEGKAAEKWAEVIQEYFVGSNDIEKAEKHVEREDVDEEEKKICRHLIEFQKEPEEQKKKEKIRQVLKLVQELFGENEKPDDIDNISNLALLDFRTNRSYGNAYFPIKRKRIIENDRKGIFVPIATKNLFLKYYSKKLGEVMYWSSDDAKDYLGAIKTTLGDFLKKEEDGQ